MKLRAAAFVAFLLALSACMNAASTIEFSRDPATGQLVFSPIPEFEDIGVVYDTVTVSPQLIGEMEPVRYPSEARRANVQGRVEVQFIVDKTGAVRDLRVVKGIGAGCDEETMRIMALAKFTPGYVNGEVVNTRMGFSIGFFLGSRGFAW